MIEQAASDEMHHLAFALDEAGYAEQARAEQLAALALDQMPPDHHVDVAGLVLKCDKYHSAGGVRTLAAGNQAGGAHAGAVGQRLQRPGFDNLQLF